MARRTRHLRIALASAVVALTALLGLPGAAGAAGGTGEVYFVHGITGVTADVYVDDNRVAVGAVPRFIAGPLNLAAGDHVVMLKNGDTTLLSARFTVKADTSIDLVAHLMADATRKPIVTVFPNDLSPVAPGKTRFVVANVAAAPPVDLRIDGVPVLRNVSAGESLATTLPAGPVTLEVTSTGSASDVLLGETQVTLQPGTLTRGFLIGDSSQNATTGMLQYIKVNVVGSGRPTKVQTGDGGQAAGLFYGYGTAVMSWTALALLAGGAGMVALNRRHGSRLVIGSRHSR